MEDTIDFDRYQEAVVEHSPVPKGLPGLSYSFLCMGDIVGSLHRTLADAIRDSAGLITEDQLGDIVEALGSLLRGVAVTSELLGYDLSEVAAEDITKR